MTAPSEFAGVDLAYALTLAHLGSGFPIALLVLGIGSLLLRAGRIKQWWLDRDRPLFLPVLWVSFGLFWGWLAGTLFVLQSLAPQSTAVAAEFVAIQAGFHFEEAPQKASLRTGDTRTENSETRIRQDPASIARGEKWCAAALGRLDAYRISATTKGPANVEWRALLVRDVGASVWEAGCMTDEAYLTWATALYRQVASPEARTPSQRFFEHLGSLHLPLYSDFASSRAEDLRFMVYTPRRACGHIAASFPLKEKTAYEAQCAHDFPDDRPLVVGDLKAIRESRLRPAGAP